MGNLKPLHPLSLCNTVAFYSASSQSSFSRRHGLCDSSGQHGWELYSPPAVCCCLEDFCHSCAGGSPPAAVSVAFCTCCSLGGSLLVDPLWAPHQPPRRSSSRGVRQALCVASCRFARPGTHQGPLQRGSLDLFIV